jgi:hypothetical protein
LSLQYETVTITIFIKNDINFLKLDLSLIYMVYIHVIFFMFILCMNLNKTSDALDLISLDNIDILNEWISEESSLLDRDDISWETIEALLSILTLDDEEICFDDENEFGGNDHLLKCLVGDFPCIPPQDQNLISILMIKMMFDLCFFCVKTFYFIIFWYFV